MTDPFIHDDAAYVLGALSNSERRAFEAHLETCPDCATRVAEVAPIPRLLAGLPEESFRRIAEPVPDTLLPGLLRAVRGEQRRRTGVLAVLGGLAAACLITLALIVTWPDHHRSTQTAQPQAMSAVVASPVHATATLTDVSWGTRIELACRYDDRAYRPGIDYWLVVVDKNGVEHPAGSWGLVPGKVTTFDGGVALRREQIATVEITLPGKGPILQLNL